MAADAEAATVTERRTTPRIVRKQIHFLGSFPIDGRGVAFKYDAKISRMNHKKHSKRTTKVKRRNKCKHIYSQTHTHIYTFVGAYATAKEDCHLRQHSLWHCGTLFAQSGEKSEH